MVQIVFNGALSASGEKGRLCRRLRRLLLKWSDPLVSWRLNGRTLRLPLSHQLPFYRREFPTYSANFERLATAVRRQYRQLVLIDVGANVGDSLALAGVQPDDLCLLIEGDPKFFRLLQANTADLAQCVCIGAMLSDRVGQEAVQLISQGGTGHLASGATSKSAQVLTLDSLLEQQPQFRRTHLLKIDVDGYDYRVLRGGQQLVRTAQPILFFEQYPQLLEAAGECPDGVWGWLQAAGYSQVLLYDNFGFWLGAFSTTDQAGLAQLNHYARQRPGCYYDVAAFAPCHREVQKAFAAGETAFYAAPYGPTKS